MTEKARQWGSIKVNDPIKGMSIRDCFAAMAMQGLLANPKDDDNADQIAEYARICADALLEELSKTE